MGSEPYSPSHEELLVERSVDGWVNTCDRWTSIVMEISGGSEPQRELITELKQLSTDIAFRAAGWRIIATPLREFVDDLAGYAYGLEPWDREILKRRLRGADIIVEEVRDRACASALERSTEQQNVRISSPESLGHSKAPVREDQAPTVDMPEPVRETHCGGDNRYPTHEWILFRELLEDLGTPETTLQRWVKELPDDHRGDTEPIRRVVIRRDALPGLRARETARSAEG